MDCAAGSRHYGARGSGVTRFDWRASCGSADSSREVRKPAGGPVEVLVNAAVLPPYPHMPKSPKRGGTGAEFVKWFRPLIDCLHELGAAKPREAADWIAEKESVPPAVREVVNKNGGERFVNQVCFARQYLLWEGLIDGSKHGIWSLTPHGSQTRITDEDARRIFSKWSKFWADARKGSAGKHSDQEPLKSVTGAVELVEVEEIKEGALLNVLRGLSPKGFEHFCRHLLLAYDFENVKVTGRTGDGGIDGEGQCLSGGIFD